MKVIATLGALHATAPLYNAQTILEILGFLGVKKVFLADVTAQTWVNGTWRDLDDPVLFALEDARIEVEGIAPDWAWALAEQDKMLEFLKQFPQGQQRLAKFNTAERDLKTALSVPLDASTVYSTLLEVVKAHHLLVADILEEGPGTAHRLQRLQKIVESLEPEAVVLASLDDVPTLLELGLELPDLTGFQPSEASRFRAIIDRAYRLEDNDDLDALVHQLLALDAPADTVLARLALEARFAASGLYLAVGDWASARDLLEAVSQGQFERPSYLAGFVLARLGQVRDLMLERDRAKRAYTAALALAYCPLEAREVAQAGLQQAFRLD
jgi:tetratricopeptide (TPR) repeat protein